MNATLVFKLYGDFHWPPTPKLETATAPKRGCIEIYYAKLGATAGPYRAYLVWVPQKKELSDESPAEPSPESPSLRSLEAPLNWFEDPSNANKPIWIDGGAVPTQALLISFRGAFLFEQYAPASKKETPELRWPLVPEYKSNEATLFSALTINGLGTLPSTLEFELSLPLPVGHANNNKLAAFPLRAMYSTLARTAKKIGLLYRFDGRGFKNGIIENYQIEEALTKRLGSFDLASASQTSANYLLLPAKKDLNLNPLSRFWPASNTIARSLLQTAGLNPTFEDNEGPRYGYLHLTDTLDERETFTLGYRTKASTVTLGIVDDVETPVKLVGPVHIHIQFEWTVASKHVWNPEAWTPKVSFRLIWSEPVNPNDFSPLPDRKLTFARYLLAVTAKQASITRQSLPLLEGLQPVSLLPDINVVDTTKLAFVLRSQRLSANCADYFKKGKNGQFISWRSALPARLKLTLAKPTLMSADESTQLDPTKNSLPLTATLKGFSDTQLTLSLGSDETWAQQEADSKDAGSPYFASFSLKVESVVRATEGRIGSLLLDVPAQVMKEVDLGFLRTAGRALGGRHARRYNANGQLNASLSLTLPVSRITPIATDVARTDRSGRPAPLLINLDPNEPTNPASTINYLLRATETFGTDEDRLLTVSLLDKNQDQGAHDYLLLSEQPYSILRFRQTLLGARGSAATAEVAIYSSDDRLWQYRNTTPLYHFMLPPQAFGESADKPRRMELHDRDALPANGAPPAPYLENTATRNVLLRHAVQFRLTPSTDLWIQPSDVTRGYFIPEQASYELFRQRGEYGLGAAVAGLRSEFLYGLSVGVDVNSERSVSRFTRVAEISALTGNIVGTAREHHVDQEIAERWNKLSAVIASRPERLELWARDPSSPVDFTPARFAEGTLFALRSTALHSPPLVDPRTPVELPGLVPGELRFHESGLRGGALWPIESLNLLTTLRAQPESRGGTLEQVALAPFGGDAAQKAEFLNGNVKIISETRNGYVERHKIEVMGRIGALWHRAKHVVVYERTVNPSAQFAPTFSENPKTRSRRPILRKVSEYIELLQPERLYPDFPQAQARSTGFLDRVRFNSRIIHVDSAWGSDVGDFGWKIPLWNRGAAKERPQVYSMPDIAFVTVAEGDGENPLVAQECQDPDQLYFFAEFNARINDTDLWQPRVDIDYANLPLAQTISEAVEPKPLRDTDARRPAVSRILPGARRFTWRLAPSASKTAINAGRAQTPIYVGVESVSFMRAAFAKDAANTFDKLAAVLKAAQSISSRSTPEYSEVAKIGVWRSNSVPASLKAVDTATFDTGIAALLAARSEDAMRIAYASFSELWPAGEPSDFGSSLSSALVKQSKDLEALVSASELIKHTDRLAFATVAPAYQRLASKATAQLRGKSMLICSALLEWQTAVSPGVGTVTKEALINDLAESVEAHLRPIFSEASNDVGDIRAGVEKARAIVQAVQADVENLFTRAQVRLDQLQASYDQSKPWSPERKRSFRADCQAAVSNLGSDIVGAITEARQRLSVELGDFAQGIANDLGRVLSLLVENEKAAVKGLGALTELLRQELVPFVAVLDQLEPVDSPKTGLIKEMVESIGEARKIVNSALGDDPAHAALKKAVLDALSKLENETTSVGRAGLQKVRFILLALPAHADSDLNALTDWLRQLTTEIASTIRAMSDASVLVSEQAQQLKDAGFALQEEALLACWLKVKAPMENLGQWGEKNLDKVVAELDILDVYFSRTVSQLGIALKKIQKELHPLDSMLDAAFDDLGHIVAELQKHLAPEQLLKRVVIEGLVQPVLADLLAPLPEDVGVEQKAQVQERLAQFAEQVAHGLDLLQLQALGALDGLADLCDQIDGGLAQAKRRLIGLAAQQEQKFKTALADARERLNKAYLTNDLKQVLAAARVFDHCVRDLQNNISRTVEDAQQYGNRLLASAGNLVSGNLMATPSNVLKLYSAVTSAPELAGLKSDIERIRANFDELSDVIDTTEASALLNRMGDELKALGLSFPYDKISDRLLPANLQGMDLGKLFGNIGGANLAKLFKGEKLSDSLRDAIRLTHDFDRQQARAWVQVDIDAPMPGRHTLFAIGPFQCDFVDMRIVGQLRMDASKDSDEVSQSGYGRLGATLDMLVSGQSMVRFEKFALNFSREQGLKVDFDPNNIRLNPAFQFVQDALLGLFPDAVGPMTVIKNNGIPIGVEHEYAMPVISANAGTSGISNLSIENRFRLIAHPDFILADRFSLSRPERPFIFSLFVLGGTGFVQIETEYRPFDGQLSVTVDAAAGASALLGFSCGPFSGQVFITLSAVLTYRKMIGQSGGGLSVSSLLVIAGNVDVMGIATVSIYVTLRLAYRDNGQIDADGSLSVTIKISRFFSVRARANVRYRLRDGHAQTQTSAGVDVETDPKIKDAAIKAIEDAEKLQGMMV